MLGTMLNIDGLRKSRGARCCILILFHSLQPNMRFHFITCGTYSQYAKRDTLSVLRTTRISCTRFEQQSLPRIESSTHFLACPCVLVLLCFARFIEQVVFVNGARALDIYTLALIFFYFRLNFFSLCFFKLSVFKLFVFFSRIYILFCLLVSKNSV